MTLKTQMIEDMDIFYNEDEFAEEVAYTPLGGAQVIIPAIIDRDYPFQEPYVRGPNTALAMISVKKTDVPNPQYGDTYAFDSQDWEFDPENNVTYEDTEEHMIMLWRDDS